MTIENMGELVAALNSWEGEGAFILAVGGGDAWIVCVSTRRLVKPEFAALRLLEVLTKVDWDKRDTGIRHLVMAHLKLAWLILYRALSGSEEPACT